MYSKRGSAHPFQSENAFLWHFSCCFINQLLAGSVILWQLSLFKKMFRHFKCWNQLSTDDTNMTAVQLNAASPTTVGGCGPTARLLAAMHLPYSLRWYQMSVKDCFWGKTKVQSRRRKREHRQPKLGAEGPTARLLAAMHLPEVMFPPLWCLLTIYRSAWDKTGLWHHIHVHLHQR